MIDDNLRYSGTIPDERLHDMRRDLRSPMGGGRGGSGGSGPRGAGVFLVDSVFTRSQDDTYHAGKSLFLNPLDKASYGVRIGDIVLFYLNNEGILCTGVVMAISNDDVTFKKHDEISTVGFSPSIATTEITGGHRVTVTNEGGSDSFDVMDGVQGPQGEPFEFDDFTQAQLDELRSDVASVYYRKQEATVINYSDTNTIPIPFDDFTFADMLFVDIEGLALTENQDYVINGSSIELTTPITHQNTRINFKLLTIMAITSEDLDTLLEGLADFNGATDSASGTHGLVPAPAAGDNLDVLFGNGEWGSLGLTTFSWGNDQSISIQANFDNEHVPAALFGSTSLPLASATKAGLMKLEDYSKLQNIQAGAQANVIESISVNGNNATVTGKAAAVTIPEATDAASGVMGAGDKAKLDGIAAGAKKVTITETTRGSGAQVVSFSVQNPDGTFEFPPTAVKADSNGYVDMTSVANGSIPNSKLATPYSLPTMSASAKGGAMVGDGLAMTGDALGIADEGVDMGMLSQEVQEAIAEGGSGSGYNPSLSVGRADALTGADSTAQWATRESTGSGSATVRSVQGAAVVWNQLAPALTSSNYTAYQFTDASFSDGIFTGTIGGTTTTLFRKVTYTANHRYMLLADVKAPAGVTVSLNFTYAGVAASSMDVIGTGDFNREAVRYKPTAGPSGGNDRINLRNYESGNVGSEISVKNIQLFDLTALYGAGNEPTTVAEFERMYPASYYPYSAPTLKPVQIAGIASTTAQGGELDSVEWPTQTLRAAGSVRDELTASELVTRVGVVDLGDVAWTKDAGSSNSLFYTDAIVAFTAETNPIGQVGGTSLAVSTSSSWSLSTARTNLPDDTLCIGTSGNYRGYIIVHDESYATADAFKAALSGVELYYKLATPTTTPISPALPMTYRVQQGGTESIIVPDGEISAAPIITVAEGESAADLVMDALAAIAAPDGPVATANHALNTYLTMGGKLYKVTSAIAVGETIAAGTNVTQTTVMAELIARTS